MRPLIAVAGKQLDPGRVRGWPDGAMAVPEAYVRALHRAGAQEAGLLPVGITEEEAAVLLRRFEGLLLMGGGDIEAARYGAERHPENSGEEPLRDVFEMALVRAAVAERVPTLAVCRGMQAMNVALGGTLEQHLPDRNGWVAHRERGLHVDHVLHGVRLEPGSRLARAMSVDRPECASTHHQAPNVLGGGLVPTAWSDDGLVEGIEHRDGWMVGVQWHPERTADRDPAQQRLFDALADRAREAAAARAEPSR
jgi:putative glutamine amidotransferase